MVRPEGTYTFAGGSFRYGAFGGGIVGEGLGTNTGTGSFDLVLATPTLRAGALVAISASTVSFFDASDNLLGTLLTTGAMFAGWEDAALIKRIHFDDTSNPTSILAIDNVTIEAVPEPSTLCLVGLGLVGAGIARRRGTKLPRA